MRERIYSLETEYAITHLPETGSKQYKPDELFVLMSKEIPREHIAPGSKVNYLFLVNGAKFYNDNGHPEWACPECRTPLDAAVWDKAGERYIEELAAKAEKKCGGEILLLKNNADTKEHYYGCHENYLVERKTDFSATDQEFHLLLVRYLLPFLVTRQIFTGAGKVGKLKWAKHAAFGYQISQRADAMETIVSQETRSERAIVNTRDETLGNKLTFRRLHLILGDSNLSGWASFMKLGTTGIVLRLIEDNFINEDLAFANPIKAIKEISYDLSCKRPVLLKNGKKYTAVEIQEKYLEMAENYFAETEPDEETKKVLYEWKKVLENLKKSPHLLFDRVDWIAKKMLLEREMENSGLQWKDKQIQELDIKYHTIHQKRGLFYGLQQRNVIRGFLDPGRIKEAMYHPPDNTRARVRSEAIRSSIRWNMPLEVEWDRIKLDNNSYVLENPLSFFHYEINDRLSDGKTLDFLSRMLISPNKDVRKQTAHILGQLEGDEPLVMLKEALKNDLDWEVRVAVIKAFNPKLAYKVKDIVNRALEDTHFIVRQCAAYFLSQMKAKEK